MLDSAGVMHAILAKDLFGNFVEKQILKKPFE